MQTHGTDMKEDVVWALARNAVHTEYRDLPAEAVEATKKSILDTLGVIVAASGTTPGLKGLVDLVQEGGGKKESTILGFGFKAPAWMAAFANGAMSHCLDYDDIHYWVAGHPSSSTVPSACAVAERLGKVTGKDLITAVALGNDLLPRFGYSVGLDTPWHSTLFSFFATAVTAGKLLRLNGEQTVDALGLAFCQAAMTRELRVGVGSDIGGMRNAFPGRAGVFSALLAQRGIRGVRSCFEGKAGLYNVYFGGKYDRSALTADLGKRFHGADMGYKAWPACGVTHAYIDSALALVKKHDIRPEDVAQITVFVGNRGMELCQPPEARQHPTTTMDAKYSLPFTTAVAVANRAVVIRDYSVENLGNPGVIELARKVTPKLDPDYDMSREHRAGKLEIRMKDGQVYARGTMFPYGHPRNPISREDLVNKFRDCMAYSARPVPEENVEKAVALIDRLEEVEDVSRVIRLVAPGRSKRE